MYIYKWIEGRNNLKAFCEKRFNMQPHFTETIGICAGAENMVNLQEKTEWRIC